MTLIRYAPFFGLLFIATMCNAMIMPFMGFFIVEGLGQEPWTISLYAGAVAVVVIFANRTFAKQIDQGANPFPMVGIAALGFIIAAAALSVFPGFATALTFGVLGFGASSSVMSTMFTIGGVIADRNALPRSTFNAYMRATTSTAWMTGPAIGFLVADRFGEVVVFHLACVLGLIWLLIWWTKAPRDAAYAPVGHASDTNAARRANAGLWLAVGFVFSLAMAHSLTFSALPLFAVQEVGLPGYAPGTAFSLKTFVELFAIAATPFLIARFGLVASLVGTAILAFGAIQVLAGIQTYQGLLIGAALEGFYFGLFSTLAISFVQSFAKDRPARATALYWNSMMVTLVLAGPAAGIIAQIADFRTVIQIASGFALVSIVVLALGSRFGAGADR